MIQAKQIVINGQMSAYTEAGEGEIILLLHGWGCNAHTFKDIQSELEKNFKVFAVDFPGFGKSDEPDGVWGCEEYASWTEQFIRKTNILSPIVIGHSFGGRVALMLNTKISIQKLVLTGSAGLLLDTDIENRKGKSKISSVKNIAEKMLPKAMFEWLKNRFIQRIGSADYKSANPHMREILKKVISEDLKHYAMNIQVPTLLIWGENDKDTPVEMGRAFNKLISGSELKIIPACGHYVFIDNKIEFLTLIEKFIKIR